MESFNGEIGQSGGYEKPKNIDATVGRFSMTEDEKKALQSKLKAQGHSEKEISAVLAKKEAEIGAANKKMLSKKEASLIDWQEDELKRQEDEFAKTLESDPKLLEAIEKRQRKLEEDQWN